MMPSDARYRLIHGDCRDVLKTLEDTSVHSVVTDPPYHLVRHGARRQHTTAGFMGKRWDGGSVAFDPATWAQVYRVLKPAGHLLAFGSPRTAHRMVCAIEDAGFEVIDTILWIFGSGYPKSRNLTGVHEGKGTALKPSFEPITVARRPIEGTVLENVQAHEGCGVMNLRACEIPVGSEKVRRGGAGTTWQTIHKGEGRPEPSGNKRYTAEGGTDFAMKPGRRIDGGRGRWPANLIHDGSDDVLGIFPSDAGAMNPVRGVEPSTCSASVYSDRARVEGSFFNDTGSAARFFYCPKVSRTVRNEGCEDLAEQPLLWSSGTTNPGSFQARGTKRSSPNNHPTVKPTELMRYLCRLVTPENGIVLDPFTGSGSTGKAAMLEGLRFIGVDEEADHLPIADRRIRFAQRIGYQIPLGGAERAA